MSGEDEPVYRVDLNEILNTARMRHRRQPLRDECPTNPQRNFEGKWARYVLWRAGNHEDARLVWHRAIRADARMLSYLGDFARASDDLPAPPSLPLFTDVEFAPLGWREDAQRHQREATQEPD